MREQLFSSNRLARNVVGLMLSLVLCTSPPSQAQSTAPADTRSADEVHQLKKQVDELRQMVLSLQHTVTQLQASVEASATARPAGGTPGVSAPSAGAPAVAAAPSTGASATTAATTQGSSNANPAPAAKAAADFLHGLTISALLDTYYEYNFNDPIGRVNLLRAYDVSSNNFSLNQAAVVLESAPDMSNDKRFGMRVDLQYGQATATLQGNPANELRPEIYRNIFQAYGSYWIPIHGSVLTLDFGKWASSLGIEGNYTKDQMNYSRSLWFDFLPFYHSGLRASYKVNDFLTLNYWITNGTDQTEAFNNYKDELWGFVLKPISTLSWTFNYYLGQEHPDVTYITNPTPSQRNLPMQQGTAFLPIPNAPNGKLRIADTYATWQATSALTLAAEADYVTQQLYNDSPYQRVTGGALYAAYQLTPRLSLATRGEYLADPDGFYSSTHQYLKELTFTTAYKVADGFMIYTEWRRDASNKPYFLTPVLFMYDSHQDTLGFGFVWWMGQKQGTW